MTDPSSIHLAKTTEAGRLDKLLPTYFPGISRARFQKLIADGHVAVDGTPAMQSNFKVKAGQTISFSEPPAEPAEPLPQKMALDVVFEDKHLIVINKPPGLVVHPAAGHASGTLVNALLAHCGASLSGIGGVKRPGIVHRLDKDTSGLLVVAKDDKTHQGLATQFASHGRDGRLKRSYIALVWGVPQRPRGTIETRIGRSTTNRQKMAVTKSQSAGRLAITHYEVIETYQAGVALVRCNLETGRTHQIRVHMAHLGHPVLGDSSYGTGHKSAEARLSEAGRAALKALNQHALHAETLGFEHPITGAQKLFSAPAPKPFQKLVSELRQQSKSALKS